MFKSALPETQRRALALLGKSGVLKKAYLAGGSALALQLNHRQSIDFDFFISKDFLASKLVSQFSMVGKFIQEKAEKGTILGQFEGVKFSLFHYFYPLLKTPIVFSGIKIAHLEDIAPMKLTAICDRGSKKDFIDIYFLAKKFSLEKLLQFYDQRYKKLEVNLVAILKSLTYFVDAEDQPMPKMIKKVTWKEVQSFLQKERDKLARKKSWI